MFIFMQHLPFFKIHFSKETVKQILLLKLKEEF